MYNLWHKWSRWQVDEMPMSRQYPVNTRLGLHDISLYYFDASAYIYEVSNTE